MFVLQLAGNRPKPCQMRQYTKPAAAIIAIVVVIVGAGVAAGFLLGGKSTNTGTERTSTEPTSLPSSTSSPIASTTVRASTSLQQDPLARAKAILKARGYRAVNEEQYASAVNLRVLVGRSDSNPPRERVFFFLGGDRWLGYDAKEPSGHIEVVHQDGQAVQVVYSLYRPGDSDANPTGGTKTVTFKWNGDKLVPLDEIPTSDPAAPLSRR